MPAFRSHDCLFADTPTYVVYHELILTSKEYMTQVTAVDAYWLGASVSLCRQTALAHANTGS